MSGSEDIIYRYCRRKTAKLKDVPKLCTRVDDAKGFQESKRAAYNCYFLDKHDITLLRFVSPFL